MSLNIKAIIIKLSKGIYIKKYNLDWQGGRKGSRKRERFNRTQETKIIKEKKLNYISSKFKPFAH